MWMMWHWHVSALSSGVTLVIYDGSPFYYRHNGRAVENYLAMPKLIDELGINQFGTSAKFLSVLQQKEIKPRDEGVSLKTLKAIYSTGSPLASATFRYVYGAFGSDIHLASISGGTDIIADFGTPCLLQPVHAGEIQVLGLGMAVEAWAQDGRDISGSGQPGELVCVKPFPSQPVSNVEIAEMHCFMLTAFRYDFGDLRRRGSTKMLTSRHFLADGIMETLYALIPILVAFTCWVGLMGP
jgi:acetoacetyl-CoA synthetase